MNSTMRPIHSLIQSKILNRTKNIQSLSSSIHSRLSADLRKHCWVVDVIGTNLIMMTDNPERATIIRYQQHELLKQINEEYANILETPVRRLKVKVDYSLGAIGASSKMDCQRDNADKKMAKSYCREMLKLLTKDEK